MWGAEQGRGGGAEGGKHTLPSQSLQNGELWGEDPWVPARGMSSEAARPLIGEHTPTPPATGLSCGNGDSTCLPGS